jgi:hypothetical protein
MIDICPDIINSLDLIEEIWTRSSGCARSRGMKGIAELSDCI